MLSRLVTVTALLIATATPAHAGARLVSSRLSATSNQFGHCGIVNAGRKAVTLTVEVVAFNGPVLAESEVSIEPGASSGVSSGGGPLTFYCRFTGAFSKKNVRASASVNIAGGGTVVAIPAE